MVFSIVGGSIAFATDAYQGTVDGGAAGTLAWQKQVLVAIADVAIKKLDLAENTVQVNPVLSTATKQAVIVQLQGVEDQLILYKTKVAQATTLAEIQTLNQQVGQYIQTNKNVIISAFKAALAEIGAGATAKAKIFEAQLKATVVLLKATCPQQLATITTIEAQLTALGANITALNTAIQTKNNMVISQKMNEINTLIQHLSANIKTVQVACNISL